MARRGRVVFGQPDSRLQPTHTGAAALSDVFYDRGTAADADGGQLLPLPQQRYFAALWLDDAVGWSRTFRVDPDSGQPRPPAAPVVGRDSGQNRLDAGFCRTSCPVRGVAGADGTGDTI